jgi:hypothetical protein
VLQAVRKQKRDQFGPSIDDKRVRVHTCGFSSVERAFHKHFPETFVRVGTTQQMPKAKSTAAPAVTAEAAPTAEVATKTPPEPKGTSLTIPPQPKIDKIGVADMGVGDALAKWVDQMQAGLAWIDLYHKGVMPNGVAIHLQSELAESFSLAYTPEAEDKTDLLVQRKWVDALDQSIKKARLDALSTPEALKKALEGFVRFPSKEKQHATPQLALYFFRMSWETQLRQHGLATMLVNETEATHRPVNEAVYRAVEERLPQEIGQAFISTQKLKSQKLYNYGELLAFAYENADRWVSPPIFASSEFAKRTRNPGAAPGQATVATPAPTVVNNKFKPKFESKPSQGDGPTTACKRCIETHGPQFHWMSDCPNNNKPPNTPKVDVAKQATAAPKPPKDLASIKCYECQQLGHLANNCPKKSGTNVRAVVDEDSRGATFLLMRLQSGINTEVVGDSGADASVVAPETAQLWSSKDKALQIRPIATREITFATPQFRLQAHNEITARGLFRFEDQIHEAEITFLIVDDYKGEVIVQQSILRNAGFVFGRTIPDIPSPAPTSLEAYYEQWQRDTARDFDAMIQRTEALPEPSFFRIGLVRKLKENRDLFSSGIRPTGHAFTNVPEAKEETNANAAFRKGYAPKSSPARSKTIMEQITMLLLCGIISIAILHAKNPCYPLVVGPPDAPRLVIDTSRSSDSTHRIEAIPVLLPVLLGSLKNVGLMSSFDLPKAFYSVRYHEDSSIESRQMQHDGITYQFNATIMGGHNSSAFLAQAMNHIFRGLDMIKIYVDDGLHVTEQSENVHTVYLEQVQVLFDRLRAHNVAISPKKSKWGVRSLIFCGHLIDEHGTTPDPRSKELIMAMESPTTGEDLVRFVGNFNWVSKSILDGARMIEPIHRVLEAMYAHAASRKVAKVKHLNPTHFGWNKSVGNAWKRCRHAMANLIPNIHRDHSKTLVLYCDASKIGWSGVLMQINPSDLDKAPTERANEILGCMGGKFNDTQARWRTVDQEAFAVKRSIERLFHITNDGSVLQIFTDNMDLVSILNGSSEYMLRREQPGRDRLLRWLDELSNVKRVVRHVDGISNTFADALSRLHSYPPDLMGSTDMDDVESTLGMPSLIMRVSSITDAHAIRNSLDVDWIHPAIQDIHEQVGKDGTLDEAFAVLCQLHQATFDSSQSLWMVDGKILIPTGPTRTRLLASAHLGEAGHRGVQTTLDHLLPFVFWPGMEKDVKSFVSACIHCMASRKSIMLRPWGEQVRSSARNQLIAFDFLHMGTSSQGNKKVLVVTDALTSFTKLFIAREENASIVATSLFEWIAMFGRPEILLSDSGTAFTNQVIAELNHSMSSTHHFVSARSHWANGKQERINRVLGEAFRRLLSENQINVCDWEQLVPLVQFIINNTRIKSLNRVAPITAFTGLQASEPLASVFNKSANAWTNITLSPEFVNKFADELHADMCARTVTLVEFQEQEFTNRQKHRLFQRGVQPLILSPGDLVMVMEHESTPKLHPKYVGPARVIGLVEPNNQYVYEIEYLVPRNKARAQIHIGRLQFYDYANMQISPEVTKQATWFSGQKFEVDRIIDVKRDSHGFQFSVLWEGGEITWEPAMTLYTDVPDVVKKFITNMRFGDKAKLAPPLRKFLGQ